MDNLFIIYGLVVLIVILACIFIPKYIVQRMINSNIVGELIMREDEGGFMPELIFDDHLDNYADKDFIVLAVRKTKTTSERNTNV